MATYRVAFLDVYAPGALAEVEAQLPDNFELVAVRTYDEQERIAAVSGADFILAGWPAITADLMDAAPKLKLIQKSGIGYEKIDVKAAAARGIPVAITAGGNAIPVAEHTVMLILAVYRRLLYADRSLREGRWVKAEMRATAYLLNGKTVGILGFGNIGRQVARRVRAFDTRILYFDRVRPSPEEERELGVEYRPLDELAAEADVLSVHLPYTPETHRLIGADVFSRMKPTAIVVTTARGDIVDEAALVEALKTGRILGAGLDVFAEEPPSGDHPLMRLDNVVLTPHYAGSAIDNVANVARHAFANMVRVTRGEPLPEADLVLPR